MYKILHGHANLLYLLLQAHNVGLALEPPLEGTVRYFIGSLHLDKLCCHYSQY